MTLREKYVGSWSFYKKTLKIAVPVMVQNLITNFVALIDNIMVGQVGTEQMSGVAIVNQILFVFNLALFGAVSGVGIFTAQYFGKGDTKGIRDTFRFKIIAVAILLVLVFGVLLFMDETLIRFYLKGSEKGLDIPLIFNSAKDYLNIMLIGLIPFALEQAYSGTLREGKITLPPMVAGIVAVVVNTSLNLLLIFGVGPFPELGVVGAAIATVIARFVQAIIVVCWTHAHKKDLLFVKGLYRSFKIPKKIAKRISLKGVLPLTLNEMLWGAGVAVLGQCYSLCGADVVASHNIAYTVGNLFNVLYIAFGAGTGVVIGQFLGANNLKGAKEAAPKLIFFSTAMCLVVGAVMVCFAGIIPDAYNTTTQVKSLATTFIIITAIALPLHGMLHSTYFTIRAGGKTVITFLFDAGFSWLVVVPLAYGLVYLTDLSIVPIYFICSTIEILKCIVGAIIIKKDVWLSNIT